MSRFSPFRFVAAPTGVLLLTFGVVLAPPVIAAANAQVVSAPPASTEFRVDSERRVTADGMFLVRDALARLFRSSGESFVMSELPAIEVTLSLRSVPFDTALKVILNASSAPLTYRREDGVYVIVPRTETAKGTERSEIPAVPAVQRVTTIGISMDDLTTAVLVALNVRIAEVEADLAELRVSRGGDRPQVREAEARLNSLRNTLAEFERRSVEVRANAQATKQLIADRGMLLSRGYALTSEPVRRIDRRIAEMEKLMEAQKKQER